jgi:hypothetical protein
MNPVSAPLRSSGHQFQLAEGTSPRLLAPHTSGPRDVPRCEALSLLQKTLHYRGRSSKSRYYAKRKILGAGAWLVTGRELPPVFSPILFSNLFEELIKNLAPPPCGGVIRTIAPSMPSNASPGRAAGGPRRGLVPQAPTVQTLSVVERPQ